MLANICSLNFNHFIALLKGNFIKIVYQFEKSLIKPAGKVSKCQSTQTQLFVYIFNMKHPVRKRGTSFDGGKKSAI